MIMKYVMMVAGLRIDNQWMMDRPGYHQWGCELKFTLVEKMGLYQAQLCVEMNMHGCVEKMWRK